MHAVGVTLLDERDERLDPVRVRIEVLDVEPVAAEPGAGVGDRAQVVEIVAVARVRDHDPRRVDPRLRQRLERDQPGLRRRVRVHHHGSAGLDGGRRDRGENARHVSDQPVLLDGTFEEGRLDAGVVDPFADLPDEQLGEPVVAAIGEEHRQLEERVDAGRDDDVQVDLGVDPLETRNEPPQAVHGGIDDRLDAAVP